MIENDFEKYLNNSIKSLHKKTKSLLIQMFEVTNQLKSIEGQQYLKHLAEVYEILLMWQAHVSMHLKEVENLRITQLYKAVEKLNGFIEIPMDGKGLISEQEFKRTNFEALAILSEQEIKQMYKEC